MTTWFWQDGFDEVGDVLATCKPLLTSGTTRFVGPSGNDYYDGGTKSGALASFATALASSAAGDIIVLLPGFSYEPTGDVSINVDNLTIIGCGQTNGVPSCTFGYGAAEVADCPYTIRGERVTLVNVRFAPRTRSVAGPTVKVVGNGARLRGVCFDSGQYDAQALEFILTPSTEGDPAQVHLQNCLFRNVATSPSARPTNAIRGHMAQLGQIIMEGCTVDAGTVNWIGYAVDFLTFAGVYTKLAVEELSLLRGAEMAIHASAAGYVNVQTATDGGRVLW